MTIWLLVLAVIACEAVTEILTSSDITAPFRNKFKNWLYRPDRPPSHGFVQHCAVWVDKLVNCGYCTSVWVAGFFAFYLPNNYISNCWWGSWLLSVFVIHRLSNWLHVVYEWVRRGRVLSLEVRTGAIEDGPMAGPGEGQIEGG